VLSYQVWQRLFAGAPEAVGQQLVLDGQPHTVIGVMPARFTWAAGDGVWLPLPENPSDDRLAFPFMRLKPGVSAEAAQEQLQALSVRLAKIAPHHFPKDGFTISLRNYMDSVRSGPLQTSLRLLFCAVGFLLLIACANVANLQLARSTARSREIAVRLSIGAGRRRLLRQLLTESILLSLLGGALGVLFALGATRLVVTLMPGDYLINAARITVNLYVLFFSLGVSVATGILFGLAPALQSSRPDLTDALKQAARGSGFSHAGRRTRSALLIAEVALSMVLLVGAGLTVRSFSALLDVDSGFQPERLLMAYLPAPTQQPATLEQRKLSVRQVLDEVRLLPGVEAAAIGPAAPNTGALSPYTIEGLPHAEGLSVGLIGAGYMGTVGVPLVRGRVMTEQEVLRADAVALINERAAALWPRGEDPIGQRLSIDALAGLSSDVRAREGGAGSLTVIGIVGDTKNNGQQRETRPAAFVPYTLLAKTGYTLVLRTRSEPTFLLSALRERIQAIDPQQGVGWTMTGEQMLGLEAVQPRFTMAVLCFFAAVGLVLAVAGVYSVLSYQVTQRTHEIGVRMALGARPANVQGLLLRLGSQLIFAGLGIGIAASLALGRFFESQLFGVTATDPLSIGTVALLLTVVALLSAYFPARRASRVDPLVALRHE
jgi:putative ABC transport system permease protein